jgi:cysteine/O-acetylserine efflux protein
MNIEFIPLISFILATTFSPGPNNISSASMGINFGYKKSLPYLFGIASGFLVVMLACAFVSSQLLKAIPSIEVYLSYIAFVYIVWLAVLTLRSDIIGVQDVKFKQAFARGFMLQLINPKAIIYGLTLYSTFLSSLSKYPLYLVLSAIIFCSTTFVAISTWSMFGSIVRTQLNNEKVKYGIKLILVSLLLYTAASLIDLI